MHFGNGNDDGFEEQLEAPDFQAPAAPPPLDNDMDFNDENLFSQMSCQSDQTMMTLIYSPAPPSDPTITSTNTASPRTTEKPERDSKAESHCILACAQIIAQLERYLFDELTTLDIVLDIVKRYLGTLEGLLSVQSAWSNDSCKALFSVIMRQIVSLLENGCKNFQKEKSPLSSANKLLPIFFPFGLSAFEGETDEQRSWHSQIILKEMCRSLDVVQKIAALGGDSVKNSSSSWERELEKRITTLCCLLKNEKN